jgi:hypothetical protein
MRADIVREIRQMIRQELAPILMGQIVSTEDQFRGTAQRFPSESPLQNLRRLQPYGLASRPKPGTECLVIPIGGDPTHLVVASDYDRDRPDVRDGETCLYGPDGKQQIWLGDDGKLRSGSRAAESPVVLGDVLQEFARELLGAILEAPELGTSATGPVFLSPAVRTKLKSLLTTYVNEAASNFLSRSQFVERGE